MDDERDAFAERTIRVYLECSRDLIDEREVELLDVYEDLQGADVVRFKCQRCGAVHESRRYG